LGHHSIQLKFHDAVILVFAKAPVAEKVKTRLIPDIGVENATKLYQLMLEHTISTVVNSHLCRVTVCCTPDNNHSFLQSLHSRYAVALDVQRGSDLGERMYNAISKAMITANNVIVIGTDCFQITESLLGQVLAKLSSKSKNAVVTPAKDGGYVLIGLNKNDRSIFSNIEWGTDTVMEQTRVALNSLGWNWQETPVLCDLDTIEDLAHVYKNKHQYHLNTGVQDLLSEIMENRN